MPRKTCLLLFFLIFAISLTSCGKLPLSNESNSLDTVTVGTLGNSLAYAPLYIAISKDYLEDMGISVKLKSVYGIDALSAVLKNHSCNYVIAGPELAFYYYEKEISNPYIMFAGIAMHATDALVAPEGFAFPQAETENGTASSSRHITMLQDQNILTGSSGNFQSILLQFALTANTCTATLQPCPEDSLPQTAANTGQSFALLSLPDACTATQNRQSFTFITQTPAVFSSVLIAQKNTLSLHQEQASALCQAIQQGLDYIHSHTEQEVAKVLKPYYGNMDSELLAEYIKTFQNAGVWPESTDISAENFRLMNNLLEESGILSKDNDRNPRIEYQELVVCP